MTHWTEAYLGRPYVAGGCLLLFMEVQLARFGRKVEVGAVPATLLGQVRAFKRGSKALRWAVVSEPKEGDGVLLGLAREPHHVGTYVDMGSGPRVLHSLEGQGSACPSLAALHQLGGFNVIGFYRPSAECPALVPPANPLARGPR